MTWRIEFTPAAARQVRKLTPDVARRVRAFLAEPSLSADPRSSGTALTGPSRLWRYRIGDYRVIASFSDQTLTVLVVELGHRRETYR